MKIFLRLNEDTIIEISKKVVDTMVVQLDIDEAATLNECLKNRVDEDIKLLYFTNSIEIISPDTIHVIMGE